jgi:hypothetical protein
MSRRLRQTLLAVVLALCNSVWPAELLADQVSDGQVKAAFLFNFAKFVQWPGAHEGPLVIGIAGDDDFAAIVEQTVRGRNVNGREIKTRRLASGEDPSGCQMLFIGLTRPRDAAELMQRISEPVLTVGESVQFLRDGGMVRFFVENNRVRFEISQKNAEAARLKVSSQLLAFAAQ